MGFVKHSLIIHTFYRLSLNIPTQQSKYVALNIHSSRVKRTCAYKGQLGGIVAVKCDVKVNGQDTFLGKVIGLEGTAKYRKLKVEWLTDDGYDIVKEKQIVGKVIGWDGKKPVPPGLQETIQFEN